MKIDYDLVKWALINYKELSLGMWPDPENEDNASKRKQASHHAPFESPSMLAGEVSGRVRECGIDGLLVEECYGLFKEPKQPAQLARERHLEFKDVCNRLNKVLCYCTDEEHNKGETYTEWKKYKTYRKTSNKRSG